MKEVYGNIFDLPEKRDGTEAICVTTNGMIRNDGKAVMGAGVAKAFRDKYYGIDILLARHLRENGNVPANLGIYDGCYVLTFPTKNNWMYSSDINLIEQSAIMIKKLADDLNLSTIYLPKPGCTNGHLNWEDVEKVISKHLDERFVIVEKTAPVLEKDNQDFER